MGRSTEYIFGVYHTAETPLEIWATALSGGLFGPSRSCFWKKAILPRLNKHCFEMYQNRWKISGKLLDPLGENLDFRFNYTPKCMVSSMSSPMTFETSYTGFRSGSESRSNFVCLFSAACAVKPLHTSRRCSLLYRTVMRCDRIVRRLVVISSYREHSPRLSALVGLRSLDRLLGTHSHHPWKTKICRPQSSDLNSKLTCLIPRTFVSSIYVSLGYIFDC